MTKKMNTKRALLGSIIALILCISMLAGSTYAWFTDSVTSGKNIIQSGNLDVKLEYHDGTTWQEVTESTDVFGYDNWEPNAVRVIKFRVTNNGSLALQYKLSADVYAETAGTNVAGESFLLSDYLYTEVVDANADRDTILASTTGVRLKNSFQVKASSLEKNTAEEVAIAIWMPGSVGNEANHNGNAPTIEFGINLIAAQKISESDSFGNNYDAGATYPIVAWGSATVTQNATNYEIDLIKADGGKVGSASIPAAAVDTDAEKIVPTIKETVLDTNVTIASDQEGKTFDIDIAGLKAGNTTLVTIELTVGTGLTNVKLYHNDQEVTNAVYNSVEGKITFQSASFSPYTVVYDQVPVDEDEILTDTEIPVANLTQIENENITWTEWNGLLPNDLAQQLEATFVFSAPHDYNTVDSCKYKDWYCDYYVMMDREVPENAVALGGNYGSYNWVGFNNPIVVEANQDIPLLGSFIHPDDPEAARNSGWTYADIVSFVQTFKCGVGRTINSDLSVLEGATFTVMLRITNPENTSEYINVNTVEYTFGADWATGTTNITSYQG